MPKENPINDCENNQKVLWYMAKAILTDQQYEVFHLVCREGLSFRQISKKLGISSPRVSQLWHISSQRVEQEWRQYVPKN